LVLMSTFTLDNLSWLIMPMYSLSRPLRNKLEGLSQWSSLTVTLRLVKSSMLFIWAVSACLNLKWANLLNHLRPTNSMISTEVNHSSPISQLSCNPMLALVWSSLVIMPSSVSAISLVQLIPLRPRYQPLTHCVLTLVQIP
jgi:hypothetical protein